MKNYLTKLLCLSLAMMSVCAVQASALEYSYAGANDFLFGRPVPHGSHRRVPQVLQGGIPAPAHGAEHFRQTHRLDDLR